MSKERDFSMEKYNNFNIANIYKSGKSRANEYTIDDGGRIIDFLECMRDRVGKCNREGERG